MRAGKFLAPCRQIKTWLSHLDEFIDNKRDLWTFGPTSHSWTPKRFWISKASDLKLLPLNVSSSIIFSLRRHSKYVQQKALENFGGNYILAIRWAEGKGKNYFVNWTKRTHKIYIRCLSRSVSRCMCVYNIIHWIKLIHMNSTCTLIPASLRMLQANIKSSSISNNFDFLLSCLQIFEYR